MMFASCKTKERTLSKIDTKSITTLDSFINDSLIEFNLIQRDYFYSTDSNNKPQIRIKENIKNFKKNTKNTKVQKTIKIDKSEKYKELSKKKEAGSVSSSIFIIVLVAVVVILFKSFKR